MKHTFEAWTADQNFSDNVSPLFTDAVKCYKAGVHRAALLFSYLGFLTIIKERVLIAKKPPVFEQSNWDNIAKRLGIDEQWESEAFTGTQQTVKFDQKTGAKKRDAIFAISDQLRRQISYWRDRRNDCAHYKDNEINDFHVEAFWTFLKSNLAKITIEGGAASLLAKFARHYDSTFTAAGTDVTPLVTEIPNAVDNSGLSDFWKQLQRIIYYSSFDRSDFNKLVDKILLLNDNRISVSITNFLKSEENWLARYLTHRPTFVNTLGFDATEIRSFWHTNLWLSEGAFSIFAFMLLSNMIPPEQIDEANAIALNQMKGKHYVSDPQLHSALVASGFAGMIEQSIFATRELKQYIRTNERAEFLAGFVEMTLLTDVIVRGICEAFNRSEFSYSLAGALNELFGRAQAKKTEFIEIATRLGLTLPNKIANLIN